MNKANERIEELERKLKKLDKQSIQHAKDLEVGKSVPLKGAFERIVLEPELKGIKFGVKAEQERILKLLEKSGYVADEELEELRKQIKQGDDS